MSTSNATQLKSKSALDEAVNRKLAPTAKTQVAKEIDLANNPIAKIVLSASEKPEAKVELLTKELTPESAEQADAALEFVEEMREFLANKRMAAQRKRIELASTKTMTRVREVINKMQGGVVNFNRLMTPMSDDLETVFVIRTNGKMNEMVEQIAEQKVRDADWNKRRGEIESKIGEINSNTNLLTAQIDALKLDKNWFGSIKSGALQQIASKQNVLNNLLSDLDTQRAALAELNAEKEKYAAVEDEFKEQREKLAKILDTANGEDYVKNMESIIQQALDFIDNSKNEVGEVREELSNMDQQSSKLIQANSQMSLITAILDQGIDKAQAVNQERVNELAKAPENEDQLAEVTRTQKKNDVERFFSRLKMTGISVKGTIGALKTDAVDANSLSSIISEQKLAMRELHSEGIATVTQSLNTMIQSFNSSTLSEAGENARQAISDMNDITNRIRNQGVIQAGMSLERGAKRVEEKALALNAMTDAIVKANQLRMKGTAVLNDQLANLDRASKEAEAQLQAQIGLDASGEVGVTETKPTSKGEDISLMPSF